MKDETSCKSLQLKSLVSLERDSSTHLLLLLLLLSPSFCAQVWLSLFTNELMAAATAAVNFESEAIAPMFPAKDLLASSLFQVPLFGSQELPPAQPGFGMEEAAHGYVALEGCWRPWSLLLAAPKMLE